MADVESSLAEPCRNRTSDPCCTESIDPTSGQEEPSRVASLALQVEVFLVWAGRHVHAKLRFLVVLFGEPLTVHRSLLAVGCVVEFLVAFDLRGTDRYLHRTNGHVDRPVPAVGDFVARR